MLPHIVAPIMEGLASTFEAISSFRYSNWSCVLCIFITVALYIYRQATKPLRDLRNKYPDLPGPKPEPFLAHSKDLKKAKSLHLLLQRYCQEYGRLFTMIHMGRPALVISEPEMLREILVKKFDCFHDRPDLFKLPDIIDDMVSAAQGAKWHRIRNTLSPAFSAHKMKIMVSLMNMSCDILMKKIEQVARKQETFDVCRYYQGVTLHIILTSVFGVDSDCQNDPNDVIMEKAMASMQFPASKRSIVGLLMLLPFGDKLLGSSWGGNFLFKHLVAVGDIARQMVELRRKDGSSRMDMLTLMLNAVDPANQTHKKLSDDEVVSQCVVFLLAGYETTSTTMTLVCHHLATNTEVQDKLQREIDGVWRDKGTMPSYETVHQLPYLDMVISEGLRLYPPGSTISRMCMKDCTVRGVKISKGTPVLIPVWRIHRDPDNYPDPLTFDPERFTSAAKQSRNPYLFLPFGHGPHNCIGMRFAQMEMKLVLLRILKKFSFKMAPETKHPPPVGQKMTLTCVEPVNLRVVRRSGK